MTDQTMQNPGTASALDFRARSWVMIGDYLALAFITIGSMAVALGLWSAIDGHLDMLPSMALGVFTAPYLGVL